jgi:uncharacterized protein YjiS (DUF1127 family)
MPQALDFPHAIPQRTPAPSAPWSKLGSIVRRTIRLAIEEWMVKRTVATLSALNDRTLHDIGLHRSEIECHARRKFSSAAHHQPNRLIG